MRYKVITVSKGNPCCGDEARPPLEEAEAACNDMAQRGFVLVNAFETQDRKRCCSACSAGCPQRAFCLIFASP